MADEDAGRSRERSRSRERNRGADEKPSFSFSLPPMSLPDVRLPDRIRLVFPFPDPPEKVARRTRVRASRVLLVVALADALDFAAILWAGPSGLPWIRAALGTLLSVTLVGLPGLLYAWELLAVFLGFGWLTVAPTLLLLTVARLVVGR
ncbi:hypothetical protein [Halorussus amylolyticus]|uniref:hypothetical protein n=1 Tax=Halorussus amylolyticus TaxID=1126242 RepID=UPI001042F6BB|nr:hypothetical protein [Halorussus amylolyticus]